MDQSVSDLFQPTDDGRFRYEGRSCDYLVTREQAVDTSRLIRRFEERLGWGVFLFVMAVLIGPLLAAEWATGVTVQWLIKAVVAVMFVALAAFALCFLARRLRLEALLRGSGSTVVPRSDTASERWRRPLARLRRWALPTGPGQQSLVLLAVVLMTAGMVIKAWNTPERIEESGQDPTIERVFYLFIMLAIGVLVVDGVLTLLAKRTKGDHRPGRRKID